ncbi:Steroid reductase [Oopsacas minuta]|uniref:Steroid reductase n=1 Tax=Oopsacas minuta TaxID=111878 RepID=A0AAV7JRY9_9METZ|nr:Steroid reductase [Oopsacas minuta]
MNFELNQVVSLLIKLDPGLTREFLFSSTVPLVLCSSGLIYPFYALQQGYPLCFALLPVYNTIAAWNRGSVLSTSTLLYNGTIALHGLVLSAYSLKRMRNKVYVEHFNTHIIDKNDKFKALRGASMLVKIVTWLSMSGMLSCWNAVPYLYTIRGDMSSRASVVGISLIVIGSVLQAIADYQKQRQKYIHGPNAYCKDGVYKLCRHPNYLGELILNLGVFISGYSLFPSIPRWILVGIVPLLFVPMMVSVTNERAIDQEEKYANQPSYKEYQANVKKLIPFVW